MRSRITVQHSDDARLAGLCNHRTSVVFSISRVNHDWSPQLARENQLLRERPPLLLPRRIVVVIVEPALSDGDCTSDDKLPNSIYMLFRIESDCIVRMYAGGAPHKAGIRGCYERRSASGAEDILGAASRADADNRFGSAVLRALDYRVAVAVERLVGEVRVTVDVPLDIPIFLGHFLSIQRRVGPAM